MLTVGQIAYTYTNTQFEVRLGMNLDGDASTLEAFSAMGKRATTWKCGDVNNSGLVNLDDILGVLSAFSGTYNGNITIYSANVKGAPALLINLDDILGVLGAFGGNCANMP